jgi:hypothetical protein
VVESNHLHKKVKNVDKPHRTQNTKNLRQVFEPRLNILHVSHGKHVEFIVIALLGVRELRRRSSSRLLARVSGSTSDLGMTSRVFFPNSRKRRSGGNDGGGDTQSGSGSPDS